MPGSLTIPLRIPLRTRLMGAFGLAMVAMTGSSAISILQLQEIGHSLDIIDSAWLPVGHEAARMAALLESAQPGAADGPVDLSAPVASARATFERLLSAPVRDRAGLGGCLRRLDAVEDAARRYNATLAEETDPAVLLRSRAVLSAGIDGLAECSDRRIRALAGRARHAEAGAERIAWIAACLSLSVGGGLVLLLRRSLQPLDALTGYVRQLSAWEQTGGEPPAPPGVRSSADEIALLSAALRRLSETTAERNRARVQLVRAERLALAGELLASVTHEIRNPLNALSLHGELLTESLDEALDAAPDPDPERRAAGRQEERDIARRMLDQIRRIDRISARYLELARPHRPSLIQCDPIRIARDLAAFIGPDLERRGLSVSISGDSLTLCLDESALRQILLNLLRNAAEAGAAQAALEIRAQPADPLSAAPAGIVLTLDDDGPGMEPEIAARIFEPFFTTRSGGTGLGLAITRQLVEGAGGTISCATAPSSGCRFRVYLPLHLPSPPERPDAEDPDRR